jgi:inorganic pyrophosphatase
MVQSFLQKNSAVCYKIIFADSIDWIDTRFHTNHGKRFEIMRKYFIPGILLFFALIVFQACSPSRTSETFIARDCRWIDDHTLARTESFLTVCEAVNPDGTLNVVVEIPAGFTSEWEVDKTDGTLRREIKDGKPRTIDYLGYPGNYGMVPGTLLAEEQGGDGDPLDVILLGPSLPRGSVIQAKAVGVLRLLDDGEMDDKIIAVLSDTSLGRADRFSELVKNYPGIDTILEVWFTSYKEAGRIRSGGFDDAEAAMKTVREAKHAFQERTTQ